MSIAVGDIVDAAVIRVEKYACWVRTGKKTGFSHCVDWSVEKPVPDNSPKMGEMIRLRVFKIVTEAQSELPLEVTYGGTISVDFAGTQALVDEARWKAYLDSPDSPSR